MKRPIFLSILILVWGGWAFAQPLSQDETESLLNELATMAAQRGSMRADFAESRNSPLLQNAIESKGTLVFEPPGKFRRSVTSRPNSEAVSNGETLWIYYPDFSEVEIYSLKRSPSALSSLSTLLSALAFHDLERNFSVAAVRADGGTVLNLLPRSRAARKLIARASIYLDDELQARRADWESVDGERVVIDLSKTGRASATERDFEFRVPANANVVRPFGD